MWLTIALCNTVRVERRRPDQTRESSSYRNTSPNVVHKGLSGCIKDAAKSFISSCETEMSVLNGAQNCDLRCRSVGNCVRDCAQSMDHDIVSNGNVHRLDNFGNTVEDIDDYEYLSSSPDEKALVEAAARYCYIIGIVLLLLYLG